MGGRGAGIRGVWGLGLHGRALMQTCVFVGGWGGGWGGVGDGVPSRKHWKILMELFRVQVRGKFR